MNSWKFIFEESSLTDYLLSVQWWHTDRLWFQIMGVTIEAQYDSSYHG